jgi:hypothetical protein
VSKHHLIRRSLAGGLVIAAAGFPAAAQARFDPQLPQAPVSNPPSVQRQLDQLQSNVRQGVLQCGWLAPQRVPRPRDGYGDVWWRVPVG